MTSVFPKDLTGLSFGRWTVLREATKSERGPGKGTYWICRCSCDARSESSVRRSALTGGASKSCGCLTREAVSAAHKTHGQKRSSEYFIWTGIKQRCRNPRHAAYASYGGRGIKVCDRWLNSFEDFLADMGKRPGRQYTIDRKDNDGDYSPENCCWSTQHQQAINRRDNNRVRIDGLTRTVAEWRELGYSQTRIIRILMAEVDRLTAICQEAAISHEMGNRSSGE